MSERTARCCRARKVTSIKSDERLLLLAPVGRDGELLAKLAASCGYALSRFEDCATLVAGFRSSAGVVLVTEEALGLPGAAELAHAVEEQPAWSDVPFLILISPAGADARVRKTTELMSRLRNVTVIERPAHPSTVAAAVDSALRARRRQLALRDAWEKLRGSQFDLKESEERYRTLTDAVPHLVWSCLPTGECDYLSHQWEQYTGVTLESLLRYQWLSVVHPDDKDRTSQAWLAAIQDLAPYDLDYRIRGRDGDYRWFRTRGKPVRDKDGRISKWYGTCTDIHDRVQAEQAIELANKVGGALSADWDLERIVQTLTEASTKATGAQFGAFFYNVMDEKGDNFMLYTIAGPTNEVFAHLPMPRNTPIFAPTFLGEGVVRSEDITKDPRYGQLAPHFGLPEGHPPVRSYLAIPVISRSGDVIGGLLFGHGEPRRFGETHERAVISFAAQAALAIDNSRLYQELKSLNKELERRVEERTESLQEAVRELEGFTYSVSHDMRTPLRAIVSNAGMILEDFGEQVPSEAQRHLQRISNASVKMSDLVEGLLHYARLRSRDVQREPVDMTELVEAVADVAGEENGHPIDLSVEQGLSVNGDRELLRMALHNLIGNAVKYRTKERPLKVLVGRSGDAFYVKDNGIGFDMRYADKLFLPFERLHRDSDYPGTGIGLANVKRIVERHGGRVCAESAPDKGSTFWFTVP